MKKVRIGNDIHVNWDIYDSDGNAYILEYRDIKVYINVSNRSSIEITNFTKLGNRISFDYLGKDQRVEGIYILKLVENDGKPDMVTYDVRNAFELVPHSWLEKQEGSSIEVEYVDIASNISIVNPSKPYLSLERIHQYLYKVTFDSLPEYNTDNDIIPITGCSSFVRDCKLYRNLDFNYDNAASFIVRCPLFECMSFLTGLNDGNMDDTLIAQLPYRLVDGRNVYGIMVSVHVLFNDWDWHGCGNRTIPLINLPFLILNNVKSMNTIEYDLGIILDNLTSTAGLDDTGYLLQCIVTDGTITYVVIPPDEDDESYRLVNATSNPKLSNFRWVNRGTVTRSDDDIQIRPTGIERWNMMADADCTLEDLRFTAAYENNDRLSEFIGIDDTTKESSDQELEAIYNEARTKYQERTRNGETWHTMHSVVYGNGMERLNIQENWVKNYADYTDNIQLEFIPTSYINALSFD